jgi:hypothetical protein
MHHDDYRNPGGGTKAYCEKWIKKILEKFEEKIR